MTHKSRQKNKFFHNRHPPIPASICETLSGIKEDVKGTEDPCLLVGDFSMGKNVIENSFPMVVIEFSVQSKYS